MNNFVFRNPTKLIFGKGTIPALAGEIPAGAKVMMTYGGGSIRRNGVYDRVKEALSDRDVIEFGGIEPNPRYETLMRAVALARESGVGFLLAVGGGSVIDGTKFIAAALKYPGDPWEFLTGRGQALEAVPFGTVLTLPATGSEMNNGAVVSRQETREKYAFHNPNGFPVFSILDPEVCYSLPGRQIANGVVDAFVHVCEQYLTYPSQAMVEDRFSEGVLRTLIELGPQLMRDPADYDRMSNFMLAATMALNGFLSMGVPQDWATHMIGHELTALHGLDHAVTLAIVLPSLLREMRVEKHDKLVQYAERVWDLTSGTDEEKIDRAIEKTERFFRETGIPTTLHEHGVGEEVVEVVAGRFEQRGEKLGETGAVTPDKVRKILRRAL